jgi:hypothetical protein
MIDAGCDGWLPLTVAGLLISFALTVISGVKYVIKSRDVLFAR